MIRNFLFLLFIVLLNFSCSKEVSKNIEIKEKSIELQVMETYNEGLKELEAGDVLFAAKKFNEVEIMFPQSKWAPRSTLMAAYAYYSQDYYFDSIEELKIFLRKYPNHEDVNYAHYMIVLIIMSKSLMKKILTNINVKKRFEYVVNTFPDTDYALDSKFKLDLINDILASKEMYLGRYYFEKRKWIPAINRFRKVVDDYSTTIYIEEAIYRLVEVYYTLGLVEEAEKYANLLGYNYQSSEWYKRSYGFFNKVYAKNKIKSDNKKGNLIKRKFKSLFE